jgi:putative adhesin
VLALALVALLGAPDLDTTVAVQRGQRLEISVQTGEIAVRTWARNAVRIQATGENLDRIGIDQSASVLGIRGVARRGGPGSVAFEVSVPAWMSLRLSGVNTGVRVAGTDAAVTVETLNGDVEVSGGNGLVSLRSLQGAVTLIGAKGKLDVNSVNSEVRVRDVSGELQAETVNGEIRLEKVQSDYVDASTVNGDVLYDGTIRAGGRYRFATHNGDVTVTVADGASAVVSVSTFQGDFESSFPVTLTERHGKRFEFTLGGGSARIDLESFGGTIRLVRPGEAIKRHHDEGDPDD